jgi:hypothetical protein
VENMAMESIDNALITQFSDMIHVEAQQIRARLRPYVKIKKMTGDVYAYDGLGVIEAQEVQGRIQPTVFSDIEHLRRKIARRRFTVTLPIDDMDVRAVLLNPEGEYAGACIRAMERVFDKVVVDALFATVLTGRDFDTSVTYANDGGFTVDATSGLTYEKLLEIKQNYIDADVGNDIPELIVMGLSGDEHTDLMSEIELTSGDYTRQFVIEKGEISMALGMNLVKFAANANTPILSVSGGVRDCFAMSSRGICVGMSKEMSIKIDPRPDYVDVKQVQIVGILGAVRTEGVLIQKVQTTD